MRRWGSQTTCPKVKLIIFNTWCSSGIPRNIRHRLVIAESKGAKRKVHAQKSIMQGMESKMAGKNKNEASSSSISSNNTNTNLERGQSKVVDWERHKSPCGYCKSPALTSIAHGQPLFLPHIYSICPSGFFIWLTGIDWGLLFYWSVDLIFVPVRFYVFLSMQISVLNVNLFLTFIVFMRSFWNRFGKGIFGVCVKFG